MRDEIINLLTIPLVIAAICVGAVEMIVEKALRFGGSIRASLRRGRPVLAFALICGFAVDGFAAEKARRARTFADVYAAAVRVSVSGARGSGTIIGYDAPTDSYLVATNYHVVTNEQTAVVETWAHGARSSVRGKIVWRSHDQSAPYDFALISVSRDWVETNKLCYVPLAGEDARVKTSEVFDSAGCPKGSHVWAWRGAITSVNRTNEFIPAPYPGQSGSGIFAYIDGLPWYVGTLTWLVGAEGSDDSKGAYIPVGNLWRALGGKRRTAEGAPWRAPADYHECPVIGVF